MRACLPRRGRRQRSARQARGVPCAPYPRKTFRRWSARPVVIDGHAGRQRAARSSDARGCQRGSRTRRGRGPCRPRRRSPGLSRKSMSAGISIEAALRSSKLSVPGSSRRGPRAPRRQRPGTRSRDVWGEAGGFDEADPVVAYREALIASADEMHLATLGGLVADGGRGRSPSGKGRVRPQRALCRMPANSPGRCGRCLVIVLCAGRFVRRRAAYATVSTWSS